MSPTVEIALGAFGLELVDAARHILPAMGETFAVRGRVLGEDGRSLAGVRVYLGRDDRSAETEADGTFAFDGLERAGIYWIRAREGDCYASMLNVTTEDEFELRMRRGTTFIARVYADGAPLAGATVAFDPTIRAITDERGMATIRGVPPESVRGHVMADGRATHQVQIHAGGVVEQTIELARGAEVSGRVIDRSGRPVNDVRVLVTGASTELSIEGFPNTDGCWRVFVPEGRYQISAAFKTRKTFDELTVDCDGQTPQRDLVLRIGNPQTSYGRIAGIVVDEQGRPAEGARIRVGDPSGSDWPMGLWRAQLDAIGRFESVELDEGEFDVVVSWGHMRRHEIHHRARVGETTLRLVLPTGATLVGRALLDGAPLPYFGVAVSPHPEGHSPKGVRAEDGRFVVSHVPSGSCRVTLLGPGTQRLTTEEILVTGNETIDLGDLALARGHRVTGVVRDPSGAAVADARVLVGRLSAITGGLTTRSRIKRWFEGQYDTTTDETGAYVLDGIYVASEPGFPQVVWATHPITGESVIRELPEADTTIDFVLVGRGRIEGVVEGLGVGHVMIAVRADEPVYARLTGVIDRRFGFDVPPGDYVVRVGHLDDSPSSTVTVLADQTVSITL